MIELSVVSDIDAPADRIWDALTDLSRFEEWNPFIREARGTPAVGAKVRVHVRPWPLLPLTFEPTVVVCDENRELRWRGHFLTPWLASGDHRFKLEPSSGGRIRFVQEERFTGLLPRCMSWLLEREARRGFQAMNRALKARVERPRVVPVAVAAAS